MRPSCCSGLRIRKRAAGLCYRVKSPPQALPEAPAGGEENFAVSSGFKLDINGFYVYLCYIRPHTTSVHVDCARTLSHACAEFIARCRRTLFVPSGETVSLSLIHI